MQLMTWTIARLGSRFSLLFEPYRRRVMHSAAGRFLDQPLDLMVGFIEPDGTERVLPLCASGEPLQNCEQFDRVNSITFRGYSEKYRLRFEFNVHSAFYPQDQRLCVMPAFYLEMRINPVERVRWSQPVGPTPDKVKVFLRVRRPHTTITCRPDGDGERAAIDLCYRNTLTPSNDYVHPTDKQVATDRWIDVAERIVSLNPGCATTRQGDGLTCELPVTEGGSGVKWRLVWGAHVADPVLQVRQGDRDYDAPFCYTRFWKSIDEVIAEAIETRDDRLAHSRRFEKVIEQAPLDTAQRHLLHQSFQGWLSNTFWCDLHEPGDREAVRGEWFSVWEGSCFFHSTIDVEYNVALLYLTLWPELLAMQLRQWTFHEHPHEPSGGGWLSHDMGAGGVAAGQAYPHHMEVEENCNFLLLLQAYTRWTGDVKVAGEAADLVERLANYLLWSDRDASGFPSEGVANTIDDASPAIQYARKQTYLAIKRLAALRAAADVLGLVGRADSGRPFEERVKDDAPKIEHAAWLGDHYAVCIDKSAVGLTDVWSKKPLPFQTLTGWDAYSIYTGNGLLLPMMVGQPPLMDLDRLRKDIYAAARENLGRYGCGHTSSEPENVWISQNLWRDMLARYMKLHGTTFAPLYWDMQVMSNTGGQSLGFIDTYINNYLCFYPRGVASIGYLLASPRLIIDRLAAGGSYITVDPDRDGPQRWPLLPLADWKAGKIPVVVVDDEGRATIEGEIDPVIIYGGTASPEETPTSGLIG
jgi:hypothetical protein